MRLTRRHFLRSSAGVLLLSGCGEDSPPPLCTDAAAAGALDDALTELHAYDGLYADGLANHGPMGAETLTHLGYEDRLCDWAAGYVGDAALRPLPAGAVLSVDARDAALGAVDLRGDWVATYLAEVQDGDPIAVATAALPGLLSGIEAGGFHALIRLAHALRALQALDSAPRRAELAHALGLWSAIHGAGPGEPGAEPVAGRDVLQVLSTLPLLPEGERQSGLIATRLEPLREYAPFLDSVATVDLDAMPVPEAVGALSAAFARLLIADRGRRDIGLLHAITGTAALRLVLPYLEPPAQRRALGGIFRGVAGVHATHSEAPGLLEDETYTPTASPEELVAEAVRGGGSDPHDFKLTEALLREHALDPRPELLAAAEAWL